ncbi:HPr family phosphocarrier protein [Henriciella marina]|uniref:HPr family phosphocarrier protein n=1 Tax=Henriciella marina TaxID=453851 RepID=A0ABT4LWM5_9PROT|nr:HPr family phosphocarrier protein [Henriciella marina]MCZ4298762.1 HPr family phosphocarrier protein [Henriciella marina]
MSADGESLVERRVQIVNRKGLHARASAKLARLAMTLPAQVFVVRNGEVANAHSIMDLLMLAAHQGSEVEVRASGAEAAPSVDAVCAMIDDGFGENDDDD